MKINIKKDLKNILLFTKIFFSRKRNLDNKFTDIRFITFRNFFPNGGAGGGGAVASCLKLFFAAKITKLIFKWLKLVKTKNSNTT